MADFDCRALANRQFVAFLVVVAGRNATAIGGSIREDNGSRCSNIDLLFQTLAIN